MSLEALVKAIPNFDESSHSEKIGFFGWYLHLEGKDRFTQADIRSCYDGLHCEKPSNVNPYLVSMAARKPKRILRDSRGFYLTKQYRDELAKKWRPRQETIEIEALLTNLSGRISDQSERLYLAEALACFRVGAFRATIVMTWNVAFSHLEEWILSKHLGAFNAQIPLRTSKKGLIIATKDNFGDLKEFEVIDVCKSAGFLSPNLAKILHEKLIRRNMAAHPSLVTITKLQAEDFVSDLVNNVVTALL